MSNPNLFGQPMYNTCSVCQVWDDETCFFRQGSVVVDYKVVVAKNEATQTLGAIVDSIKTEANNGSFGNYKVDVTSVKGEGNYGTWWCYFDRLIGLQKYFDITGETL